MKFKITVFTITALLFATIAVAHVPQFPTIAPGTTAGVLNLQDTPDSDDKPGGPSKRELVCSDLIAFAFP